MPPLLASSAAFIMPSLFSSRVKTAIGSLLFAIVTVSVAPGLPDLLIIWIFTFVGIDDEILTALATLKPTFPPLSLVSG